MKRTIIALAILAIAAVFIYVSVLWLSVDTQVLGTVLTPTRTSTRSTKLLVNSPSAINTQAATKAPLRQAPSAQSTITMGETNILPNNDSGDGNVLKAQQATLSQSATIQSMSFYVITAVGRLRLGVYDATGPSGGPGALKAQTAEFTPTVGWNTQNVLTPTQLPAGTYWLSYLPESNNLHFAMQPSGSRVRYSYAYGPLPATYSTSPQSGTYHFSFYATLVGVLPTNTPTGVPTTATSQPTRTATKTSTRVVTATPTAMRSATNTPLPLTNTPVPATNTATTVPPTATNTATKTPATLNVIAINSGGVASSNFMADANYSGGNTYSTGAAIDTSAVTNSAPQVVYQTERWGGFTYTIPGLTPGAAYTARLHFAEIYFTGAGQRQFNVAINGVPVLSNFDIVADIGAANKADLKQFSATANASGQIIIAFTPGALDNPKVNGIEVMGGASSPTNTPLPPTSTPLPPTPTNVPPTATSQPTPASTPVAGPPVYPFKASANGRYLVDQNNVPFLIKGDSAQAMIGALSEAQAQTYLTSRAAAGINVIWTHMLCGASYSGCHPDGSTYDGIPPFTTPNDISTPNPAYFARVDRMIQLAGQSNITVFASAIETINWLSVLRSNGTTKAYNYGVYLGNRYKSFPNLVWFHGNDFQTWSNSSDDAVVRAVAEGIKSVDANHLQTVELNYDTSGSLDDSTWMPILGIDAAYSYYPQYAQVLKEYNRATMPVMFYEGVYEYQDYMGGYLGPYTLRNQEYWSMLSGASGQLYGNVNIFRFPTGWQSTNWQSSPGVTQFGYADSLFGTRRWYDLIPDQNHTVVTAGYGTYANCCANANSDYMTAARTADGKLVMAYMPTMRTITVNMGQLTGTTVTARWYDPTNGTYTAIGSFSPSGLRQFTPPGNNSGGDGDWVLVLEAN